MFLSIIVPVFNAEKYIGECINSFLVQSCEDWELILVDDGSIDNSYAICESFAKNSTQIKLFHIENSGASAARNYGLKYISGEYVSFVDSDDWVSPNYVETIKNESCNCDVVFWGIDICRDESNIITKIPETISSKDNLISEQMLDILINRSIVFFGFNVLKAFKASLLKKSGVQYREQLKNSEDHVLMLEMLMHISTMKIIPQSLYRYRILNQSLSHSSKRYLNKSYVADVFYEILPQVKEKWNTPYIFYQNKAFQLRIEAFSEMILFKKSKDILFQEICKIISSYNLFGHCLIIPFWLTFVLKIDALGFKGRFLYFVLWLRMNYKLYF